MAGKLRAVLGVLFAATLIGNAACSGDTGPAGPAGKQGPKGDPGNGSGGGTSAGESISAVLPNQAFLGRTVEVTIVGNNTTFDSGSNPEFGAGINVKKAIVASPTSIVATIEITNAAKEGLRDVAVGSDIYKGAFNVSSPLKVTTEIPVQQGGFVVATIEQLDPTTPFSQDAEITSTADDVTFQVNDVESNVISLYVLADVFAKTGSVGITVQDDAADSASPTAFSVGARAATAIAAGTQAKGKIDSTSFTALYKYTPVAGSLAHVIVGTPDDSSGPAGFVGLPKSGKWADAVAGGLADFVVASGTDPFYLVAFDESGEVDAPYDYTVDIHEMPGLAQTAETEPNDTPVEANSCTAPVIYSGDVADGTDYLKVVVSGAPKTLTVEVFGDDTTDVDLTLYGVDGVTVIDDEDNYPSLFGNGKELISQTIDTDGTYYISVAQGASFDPSSSTYKVVVAAE